MPENTNSWRDDSNRPWHLLLLACKLAPSRRKAVLSSEVGHGCVLQPRIYAVRETRVGAAPRTHHYYL